MMAVQISANGLDTHVIETSDRSFSRPKTVEGDRLTTLGLEKEEMTVSI